MSRLTTTAIPTVRETLAIERAGRPLVVELRPKTIFIREKGTRTGYEVTYGQIYRLGATAEANQIREDRWRRRQQGRRSTNSL